MNEVLLNILIGIFCFILGYLTRSLLVKDKDIEPEQSIEVEDVEGDVDVNIENSELEAKEEEPSNQELTEEYAAKESAK